MILTLLLLIIIISVILGGIRFSRHQTFISEQKIKWIFTIYVGILAVSAIVYMFLPKDFYAYEIDSKLHESTPAPTESEIEEINFYEAVADGTYDQLEGVYQKGKWEFDYTNDELTIRSLDDYLRSDIFVEHKEMNDNKIEAAFYTTKSIIGGIDVTEEQQLPYVNLANNILQITIPRQVLNFKRFDKEAVIAQFTGGSWIGPSSHSITKVGTQMLYIKVPKDVKIIEAENVYIEFVENIRQNH